MTSQAAQTTTPAPAPASQAPVVAGQQPFMMDVSPPPPARDDLGHVIVCSLGLTGAMVLAAVLSGAVLASLWILLRKWRRTYDHDAPPTLGPVPLSTFDDEGTRPPSTQNSGATLPPSGPTQ